MKHVFSRIILSSSILFLSSIAFAATSAASKSAVASKPVAAQSVVKPVVAQAVPLSSSGFGELTFFPEEKTFVNTTSLGYNSDTYSITVGGSSTDYYEHTSVLSNTLEYSFLKNQEFFANLYYSEFAQRAQLGNAATDAAARGFSNPEVGYKIRLLTEGAHEFNLDLGGSLAPNFLDSKAPSYIDGTTASGNNILKAFVNFTGKHGEFFWKATPELVYHGDQTQDASRNGIQIKTDGYLGFVLIGQGQYILSPKYLLDFGVNYVFIPKTHFTIGSTAYDRDYHSVFGINVGMTDIIMPNKFVLFAALQGTKTTDSNVTTGNIVATYTDESGLGPVAGFSIIL